MGAVADRRGVFTVGELHTNAFYLAPFAVGGAIAAVLAAARRRRARRGGRVRGGRDRVPGAAAPGRRCATATSLPTLRTGTAALVGQPALVLERIANREGVGTVKIGGEVWTARAFDEDQVIEAGEQVEVVEIRGATALVMP